MNWKIFEVKYEGKETSKFEELAYKLFCSEFECETGILRYHNQTGIETEPINKNGKNYGFQAKYYTTSISSNKTDIINSIKKAKSKNPALNIIYLYLNKELSESSKINQKKPSYQMEIEKNAKKLQIEIVWRVPSNLEIQLSLPKNRYIYNEFFHLGEIIEDEKLISQIKNLNNEYKKLFSSLKAGLIQRKETYDCIEKIKKDNSIIIHGKAGYGKSGCTMGIINYCEEKEIEYIAIKLDKRIPNGNLSDWSKKLGFPLTIPEAINQISSDKKAVIILDQLDAIRWTESNSYEAISICTELINKLKKLNIDREQKISIIFVCRTYDLENDNNIKFLFNQNNENELKWEKIEVEKLSKEDTKELVGEKYLNFIPKLKDLLRIPSNLYIWEHLD
jgi:hypothetical protein